MRVQRYIPLLTLLLILLTSSIYYLWSISGPSSLSATSDRWDGASEALKIMKERGNVELILSSPLALRDERDPERALYIALGPERRYTSGEVSALMDFVDRGGRVLLTDDTGAVNPFTERFGIRVSGYPVYDQYFLKNPSFLLVEVNTAGFSGVVMLDGPTTVESRYSQVWARTSEEGWIDFNGNGIRDPETAPLEVKASFPLMVEYNPLFKQQRSVGNILVIADSSLFMNDILPRANNTEFLRYIINYLLPGGGRILLDESVHPPADLGEASLRAYLKSALYLQQGVMAWGLVILSSILLPVLYMRYYPLEELHPHRILSPSLLREAFLGRRDMERLRAAARVLLKEKYGREDVLESLPPQQRELRKLLAGEKMTEEEVNRCLIILSRM